MYRVSETISSSGAGSVPGAVGGTSTGCCSGCGGAADMMEVVGAKGATATDHPSQNLDSGHSCFHLDPILDRRDRTPIGLFSEMVQDEGEDEDYFAHFGELELTEEDLEIGRAHV